MGGLLRVFFKKKSTKATKHFFQSYAVEICFATIFGKKLSICKQIVQLKTTLMISDSF